MAIRDVLFDIATEFAAVDVERLDRFIGYAAEEVNREFFGTKADRATALKAAHMLSMSARGSNAGAVTSERLGDMAVSYAQPVSTSGNELLTTSYGAEFIRLMKTCHPGPFSV